MGANEQGANATAGRWSVIARTLCFVRNGDDVLLMKRAPHRRVFPNRYNGVGGHIERDEDPLTCAHREILEETGLHVHNVRLRAVYNIDTGDTSGIALFVFTAWSETREVIASEEGTLHWLSHSQIESLDLVEDLPIIMPRILAMEEGDPPLFVHVSYDQHDVIQIHFAEND